MAASSTSMPMAALAATPPPPVRRRMSPKGPAVALEEDVKHIEQLRRTLSFVRYIPICPSCTTSTASIDTTASSSKMLECHRLLEQKELLRVIAEELVHTMCNETRGWSESRRIALYLRMKLPDMVTATYDLYAWFLSCFVAASCMQSDTWHDKAPIITILTSYVMEPDGVDIWFARHGLFRGIGMLSPWIEYQKEILDTGSLQHAMQSLFVQAASDNRVGVMRWVSRRHRNVTPTSATMSSYGVCNTMARTALSRATQQGHMKVIRHLFLVHELPPSHFTRVFLSLLINIDSKALKMAREELGIFNRENMGSAFWQDLRRTPKEDWFSFASSQYLTTWCDAPEDKLVALICELRHWRESELPVFAHGCNDALKFYMESPSSWNSPRVFRVFRTEWLQSECVHTKTSTIRIAARIACRSARAYVHLISKSHDKQPDRYDLPTGLTREMESSLSSSASSSPSSSSALSSSSSSCSSSSSSCVSPSSGPCHNMKKRGMWSRDHALEFQEWQKLTYFGRRGM